MIENITFPKIETVSLTLTYYGCSRKPVMHVDDCIKAKLRHTLERYEQKVNALERYIIDKISC